MSATQTDSMTSRTTDFDARTLTAGAGPVPRYVMGRDAHLHDTRTGLVVGPWSDAVKHAKQAAHQARR